MSTTRLTRHIRAPRSAVYRALLDVDALTRWRVPDGMSSVIHEFDGREGGRFRVSLTYDTPTGTGKTTAHTDTYHGMFLRLAEDAEVVEVLEFETNDPTLRGEMTITTTLADAEGGTEVVMTHEGLPSGVAPEDNELGTRMALDHLAALLEGGGGPR